MMETEKLIHDLTLMLMYLTRFEERSRLPIPMQPMAWKGYDFDTLNALEEDGLIAQGAHPSRSKTVVLTEEGIACAKELMAQYGMQEE